jgi:uncharacterized protein with ParB-like and HNH nuclease domain
MQASPAKVIEYFNGEKQNIIPLFQRPYTWGKSHWQTLWDDVMMQYDQGNEATTSSSHFLGAIVSLPARSVPVGVSKYLIIDGQQRLTTISILLCSLRDSLDDTNASRIQEVYLTNRFRPIEDQLKLIPTQIDRDVYRQLVLDRTVPVDVDHRMIDAYTFFKEKLRSDQDCDGIDISPLRTLTTLEHSLQVVMINLDEIDDPYLIFESLNFKGEPLTQADLVRNYILMKFRHSVSSEGGEQERIYKQYWLPLELALEDNLTDFLRHYAMKGGENVRQKGIYPIIKKRFSILETDRETEDQLAEICSASEVYKRLLNPELELNESVKFRLKNIAELEIRTSYPLLIQLFEAEKAHVLSVDDLVKSLHLIESFAVRRQVCAVPTNSLNKLFLQWCRSFPASDHYEWLKAEMDRGGGGRRFPADAEFLEALKSQPQYGRGATRYVLRSIEESYGHKEQVDLSSATVEHILPQTMSNEWIEALGVRAKEIHNLLVHTLGNLTLTGYNSELGNLSFAKKKEKLFNTHIELNRWVLEQDQWTEEEIASRAKLLAQKAISLWPGPALK